MNVSAFKHRVPDREHFKVRTNEGLSAFFIPVTVNSLHDSAVFAILSLSTAAEEGGFPVDQACCSPPLLPTFSSCTRNWNNETSFKCRMMDVVSRWASLLANLVNTINSNWKCDWPVSCVLYTQNEYKACTCKLIQRNVTKKEQSITKKRI